MGKVKIAETIEVNCADVWLGDDGILRVLYHPNSAVTLAEAKEVSDGIIKASLGKRHPMYVDTRGLKSMTREARAQYSAEEVTRWTSAVATRDTLITKVIVEFYLKLNKPPYPIKYFTSEESALEWLKQFLE